MVLNESSLELVDEGNQAQAAISGNLGLIYRTRGDLDNADNLHRKALEIEEKLGWLEDMASQYANLGLVYQMRGDLVTAQNLWTKARDLFEQIGMPQMMVERVQSWLDGLPPDTPDSA